MATKRKAAPAPADGTTADYVTGLPDAVLRPAKSASKTTGGGALWEVELRGLDINLQKNLKAEFDPSVWEHLAGTVSEPFALGDKGRVAVKVIDERGNELMRVLQAPRAASA